MSINSDDESVTVAPGPQPVARTAHSRRLRRGSPWPGAMLIRAVFERDAREVLRAMQRYAPEGVTAVLDQRYREGDRHAQFDVYYPAGTAHPLPTVVWIHGGAWISGNKHDGRPYFELLAAAGYTVVSVSYPIAPEATYPAALHHLNDALGYLTAHADSLFIDAGKMALAGDSAGAQLASQLATLTTSPAYAALLGITSSLAPDQLKTVVLNCGIYDVPRMLLGSGLIGWGIERSIWAYVGAADFATSEAVRQMSTINHVTDAFPPAYISGGNGDPLTETQAKPLAEKLERLGVDVNTLFWPADLEPSLPHEYQFHLDRPEARDALAATIAFLATALA
ncbi:alpha/beta hydrolase [Glaciibacter superstes]|uniref:alpha/beta hydrolase n=1 Tax=Glaciibacter superstes TaxID=501023 RepID=UPI0003B4DA17|nr:alpha/beta hydrolase [Glaciibacter superstes]